MKEYKKPLPNEKSERASDFFASVADLLTNLYERWQDEKEFEDINDYQTPLNPIAEQFGVKIVKMTKRPFGCVFEVDGRTYQLKHTIDCASYKRIVGPIVR